jgi:hypothetical protein
MKYKMALSKLSEEVQCELLEVICDICLYPICYKRLVLDDYNIDTKYLKECFMVHWKITDEEFNTKFPTGIPEFRADENLFSAYIQFMLDKNYPEHDEYLHTVDDIYMLLQKIESEYIWIEEVEIITSLGLNDNIFRHPLVVVGGVMFD